MRDRLVGVQLGNTFSYFAEFPFLRFDVVCNGFGGEEREWEKLHQMTDSHQRFKPIPVLISERNRHLKGWANYFSIGNAANVHGEIDRYVQARPIQHLQRRSQRPCRPPQGEPWLAHPETLGLFRLAGTAHA